MDEIIDIVDEHNRIVGSAYRSQCHGNPLLSHQAVHVLVLNPSNEIFLQKRSMRKEIQPGKWDTSVGGHLQCGEDYESAAYREMEEELGIQGLAVTRLYRYRYSNCIETEYIQTFMACCPGKIVPNPEEISEGRYWKPDAVEEKLGSGIFTPNFEMEWNRFQAFLR